MILLVLVRSSIAHPVYDQTSTDHQQDLHDLHRSENGAYAYYPGIGQIYPHGGYYPGDYGNYPSEYNYYNNYHAFSQPNPILNYNQRYF